MTIAMTIATTTATTRMTMTNGHRHRTSPLELRLYLVAFLAAVYTISWRAIGGHAVAAGSAAATTVPPATAPAGVVWIDHLPPEQQPAIAIPAGWQRASESPRASTQPARVVQVPVRRVPRVRTRSS